MKKIILFLVFLAILLIGSFNNNKLIQLCSVFDYADLSFFCEDYNNISEPNLFTPIKNGNGFLLQTTANNVTQMLNVMHNYSGFMLTFIGNKESINFLLNEAKIIKVENYENIEIIHAYVCGLLHSIFIDGKKSNLQIAINKNIITIGSPIILGSY